MKQNVNLHQAADATPLVQRSSETRRLRAFRETNVSQTRFGFSQTCSTLLLHHVLQMSENSTLPVSLESPF